MHVFLTFWQCVEVSKFSRTLARNKRKVIVSLVVGRLQLWRKGHNNAAVGIRSTCCDVFHTTAFICRFWEVIAISSKLKPNKGSADAALMAGQINANAWGF